MKKSTYSLLVNSEEKGRTATEIVITAAFIVSTAFAFFQAANQSVQIPPDRTKATMVAQTVEKPAPQRG